MNRHLPSLDPSTLVRQLRDLGVAGGEVLLVHTSYRAIRPIEGGPDAVVNALLESVGPRGTVVMPAWPAASDRPFDPGRTPVAPDLGTVAEHFRLRPETLRSPHPHAFAAAGPAAAELLADPLPIPPHVHASPVGRVFDLDGRVLLLGVQHDADTTIHLAECLAEVPYGIPGSVTLFEGPDDVQRLDFLENDHCCERFIEVGDWLQAEGLEKIGPVGHGMGRLSRSRDIVRVVTRRLSVDPLHFLHPPDAGCAECDEARSHI